MFSTNFSKKSIISQRNAYFSHSDRENFVANFHKKRKASSDFLGKDKYTILRSEGKMKHFNL